MKIYESSATRFDVGICNMTKDPSSHAE